MVDRDKFDQSFEEGGVSWDDYLDRVSREENRDYYGNPIKDDEDED